MQSTPPTQPDTPAPASTNGAHVGNYTLRFTEWRCGHHGQRPADIPVHNVEQAQLILQSIGYAISQPGHARAVLFDAISAGATAYITDDYAEPIQPPSWPRTTVYHGTEAEIAELRTDALKSAYDYAYGGTLLQWNGTDFLDDMQVVTALDIKAIEAAIAPVEWHEDGERRAVCDAPPVIKPAAELLAELREAAAELQQVDADYATEGGAA